MSGEALPVVDVPSLPHAASAATASAAAAAAAYFVNFWLCIVGSLNDAAHCGAAVWQRHDAGAPLLNWIARLACDSVLTVLHAPR
ncbi:hypothetical protein GCM10009079_16230 [Ralstonia mannitolilytica]